MESFLQFAWQNLPSLLKATEYTLLIWIVSVVFGFFFGWLLALGRYYGHRSIKIASVAYIELFRGTPMLVQLFVVYMGLPHIGLVFSPNWAAIIAIGLNTAAYQAEYFRGGFKAIKSGQMESARAIGMKRIKAIRYIIMPQAFRIALPQWSNELILELKYTSIAFTVGAQELMGQAKIIGSNTFQYFQIFLVAAIIYLVLVGMVTLLLDQVEHRYALIQ